MRPTCKYLRLWLNPRESKDYAPSNSYNDVTRRVVYRCAWLGEFETRQCEVNCGREDFSE